MPRALRQWWWVTLAVMLVGTLLAIIVSRAVRPAQVATAALVVEDPRLGSNTFRGADDLNHYVTDQAALFGLDRLRNVVAEDLNARYVGAPPNRGTDVSGRFVVGADRKVALGDSNGRRTDRLADGSINVAGFVGPRLSAVGEVRDAAGQIVVDPLGAALTVRSVDVSLIRSDGALAIVGPGRSPVVVPARGAAVFAVAPLAEALPAGFALVEGRLVITAGARLITLSSGGVGPLLDGTNTFIKLPDSGENVGPKAQQLLVASDGVLAVVQADRVVTVDLDSAVAAFDISGRVFTRTDPIRLRPPEPLAGPWTAKTVGTGLSTVVTKGSSLIEVSFSADNPTDAVIGVNAAIDEYRRERRLALADATNALLVKADSQAATLSGELAAVLSRRVQLQATRPVRGIEAQYEAILLELSALAKATPVAGDNTLATRLASLTSQLQGLSNAAQLDSQNPALVAVAADESHLRQRIGDLQRSRDQILLGASRQLDDVTSISPAGRAEPESGLVGKRLILAGLLSSTLLGAAAAYLLARRRPRIGDAAEAEQLLNAPLLGSLTAQRRTEVLSGLAVLDAPLGNSGEAYRFAAAVLSRASSSQVARIGIVAPRRTDGQELIAANLATALAQLHRPLLVIDADHGREGTAELLERHGGVTAPVWGLVNVLGSECDIEQAVAKATLGDATEMWVMGGGHHADRLPQLIDAGRLNTLFRTLAVEGAYVFVVAPPMLEASYIAPLLAQLDGVVAIVPKNSTRQDVQAMGERLRLLQVPVLGYLYSTLSAAGVADVGIVLPTNGQTPGSPPKPAAATSPSAPSAAGSANGTSTGPITVSNLIPGDVRRRRTSDQSGLTQR